MEQPGRPNSRVWETTWFVSGGGRGLVSIRKEFLFQLLLLLHPRSLVFLSAPVTRSPARFGPLVPHRWPYPDNKMLSPRFVPPNRPFCEPAPASGQTARRYYLALVLSIVASCLWQLIGWEALQGDSNIFCTISTEKKRWMSHPGPFRAGLMVVYRRGVSFSHHKSKTKHSQYQPQPVILVNAPFNLSMCIFLISATLHSHF